MPGPMELTEMRTPLGKSPSEKESWVFQGTHQKCDPFQRPGAYWAVLGGPPTPPLSHWVLTLKSPCLWEQHAVCLRRCEDTEMTQALLVLSPTWCSGKDSSCQCRRHRRPGFNPWAGKIPCRRKWWPTAVFLPGKVHVQRSLAGKAHGGTQSQM